MYCRLIFYFIYLFFIFISFIDFIPFFDLILLFSTCAWLRQKDWLSLFINSSWLSFIFVSLNTHIINSKKNSISKFKSWRIHIILFTSNNKRTSHKILSTFRGFRNLRPPDPKSREKFAICPGFWVRDCPDSCLIKSNWRDIKSWGVENDSRGCSWQICMHIHISDT